MKQIAEGWVWNQGNGEKPQEKWKWKHNHRKSMGWSKSCLRGNSEWYRLSSKNKNKQFNLPPKRIRKRRTNKT